MIVRGSADDAARPRFRDAGCRLILIETAFFAASIVWIISCLMRPSLRRIFHEPRFHRCPNPGADKSAYRAFERGLHFSDEPVYRNGGLLPEVNGFQWIAFESWP